MTLKATGVKVRQDGRIVSVAVIVVVGVNTDGRGEALGEVLGEVPGWTLALTGFVPQPSDTLIWSTSVT